jgi:hypothetical protein
MRQYHQNTREQRLAKQKEYRNNRSEEQKEISRIKNMEYAQNQRELMKNAETHLSDPTLLLATTTDIQELQNLADRRQHILSNDRNYNQCRRWANIKQVWDEDYPCR